MFFSFKSRFFTGLGILCAVFTAGSSCAQVTLPPATAPAHITALEYFIHTDPGFGNGTPIAITAGTDITATPSISTSTLPPGIHRVYLRAKDANGRWGLTNLRVLYVAPNFSFSIAAPADVTALEYFFDADPGFGMASPLSITAGQDVTATGAISTPLLSVGVHYFAVRAKNSRGHWGLTTIKPVYVLPSISLPAHPAAAPIVRAEYFVDTDPGFGMGTNIPLTAGLDVTIPGFIAHVGALGSGVHHIVLRFQDAQGHWSLSDLNKISVVVADIHIPASAAAQPFTTLEYFFDTDPGMGNGTLVTVPATTDLTDYSIAADISGLPDGNHVFYVRTVGKWSVTSWRSFQINDPLPVTLISFDAQKQKSSVLLSWKTANEKDNAGFVLERSVDARSFDSLGFVAAATGSLTENQYRFQDQHPLQGTSYYRLKQVDLGGAVSYSPMAPIHFDAVQSGQFSTNNPVGAQLRVFAPAGVPEALFLITNMQGQEVARFSGTGQQIETFQVTDLPAGTYVLQISAGQQQQSIRFQKQ